MLLRLGWLRCARGAVGPQLRLHPASDDCSGAGAGAGAGAATAAGVGELPPVCGVIAHVAPVGEARSSFAGRGVPLSLLATSLPTMTGMASISRPVVDQTGLSGLYDFSVHWSASTDAETGDTAANFRGALKSQLGLELKATHTLVEILVIDRVERPGAN